MKQGRSPFMAFLAHDYPAKARRLLGLKKKVRKCCATCSALAHSVCIKERMAASYGMRHFPMSAEELRDRYVCSSWHIEEALEENLEVKMSRSEKVVR